MPALQIAARKLCGSAALQRRLFPRRSIQPPLPPPPPNRTGEKIADEREVARRLKEIHDKREELYNLSAELGRNYMFPSFWAALQNRLLRSRLSLQVDPRPHDPDWRWLRATRTANGFLAVASCSVASYMVTDSVLHGGGGGGGRSKKAKS